MLTTRLHWTAAGRWWAAFSAIATVAALSQIAPLAGAVAAIGIGAYVRWFTPLPKWWPVGLLGVLVGWWRISVLVVLAAAVWAVWQTLEWEATVIRLTSESMTVQRGIVTTHTVEIPRRRLVQAELVRTPLGKLLGYGHVQLETAAQVEFVDRIRFVEPRLYDLVLHPDLIGR